MCRRLLTAAGQGPGKSGEVTQHTVHTLQVRHHTVLSLVQQEPRLTSLCSLHVSLLQEPWLISLHSSHTSLLQDLQVIVSVITPTFLTCISTLIGKNQG